MTTKIQATQEALRIELEKTKKLDQQKTEFLSIAAHQLRTPMSGIKWVVNMAVEGDLGELPSEAKDQLGKGLENINRMITLINSLLDVTQIETQQLQYQFVGADIVKIIKEVSQDFEHLQKEGAITFTIQPPGQKLPPVRVDVEKIKMALHNLLDNAFKYTPKKGQVAVSFEQSGSIVLIHIQDTGYGIPPEEKDRIFSKFFRGSNIQTIQADGSGLGLFIVHEIIKQHHGAITFTSTIQKGTMFTIRLPIA